MKVVIFDLDGTLIDSAPDIHAASEKMLKGIGQLPLPFDTIKSFIGNGIPKLVERIMRQLQLGEAYNHAELVQIFLDHYNAAPADKTVIYPNVVPVLKELQSQGVILGICTNKPEQPTRTILSMFQLDQFFDVIVGGDTMPVKKPDPEPLHHAFRTLNASQMLYVGDSEVDAETAQSAQVTFALYTEGYRKSEIADIPHSYLFSDFSELPSIVGQVMANPT